MLISMIVASNRPHNMAAFLENLQQTVKDKNSIELLVKIDDGDSAMHILLEKAKQQYDFSIRYIQTPRLDGYYSLHLGYQQLYEMSNPASYFIFPVNEEVRFKTQHWDQILKEYIHLFTDDFFRLKISRLKYRNYYSYHDCGPTPENYPFMTRKWVELAGGIGDCWGPDGWHQFIEYHLSLIEGVNGSRGIYRSIPIQNILIAGEEDGKELTTEQIEKRSARVFQEWWRLYSAPAQQEFRRIATRMAAYVWASHAGLSNFSIQENKRQKKFIIKVKQCKQKSFSYSISYSAIWLENFFFLIKTARKNTSGLLDAFITTSYNTERRLYKWASQHIKRWIVALAIKLS